MRWLSRLVARLTAAFVATDCIAQKDRDELVTFERWDDVLIGCCDCGLMHRYDFGTDAQGRLTIRARRDHTATAAIRRDRPFAFTAGRP